MLRYIAVVLIMLAAVAAAGAADVRTLVAFVLFAQLTRSPLRAIATTEV